MAAFVVANVAASTVSTATAATYSAQRVEAAGLAQPCGSAATKKATIDANGIYAARRKQSQEG